MAVMVMWIILFPTLLSVVLRLYTRVFIIKSYGADDNVYNFAFVSFGTVLSNGILVLLYC